jgi:hypothetical protein
MNRYCPAARASVFSDTTFITIIATADRASKAAKRRTLNETALPLLVPPSPL